jgi:hypothetical protein
MTWTTAKRMKGGPPVDGCLAESIDPMNMD